MEKTKWSYFPSLKTKDEISAYFDVRTQGHNELYHYTSLKAIDEILKYGIIRISSTNRFNDEKDRRQFGTEQEQKKHFSLCFTSGNNENLSLWYLYSGVDGKGGRMGFTYNQLVKMINQGDFFLVEYDYETSKPIGKEIPLVQGENIKVTFRDILYSKTISNQNFADLKYNTMTNHNKVTNEELEKYKSEFVGFNKSLIWYYEKETRLLISLIGEMTHLIDLNKNYAVLWKLTSKQISRMKILLAPEIVDLSELKDKEYLNKFIFTSSRVSFSENAGDIHMNICSKCNFGKKTYVKDVDFPETASSNKNSDSQRGD